MTLYHRGCNLCDAICGLRVTVEEGRVTGIRGDPDDVLSRGHLCPKGPALRDLHDDPDRLRTPVRRVGDRFEPIGWDDALDEIASRVRAIQKEHGREAVGLYIGNPTVHSHRAALGTELLTAAVGSQNRFDPNSQDGAPRLFACSEVYGDLTALPVPDVDRTSFLLLLGANPLASNGSMMALGDARGRLRSIVERGGRLEVVDPRRTETAEMASAHHPIRPGGDAPLLLALLHTFFAEGLVDEARAAAATSGLDDLRRAASGFSPERVEGATGLSPAVVRDLARRLARSPSAAVYGRVGVCQNELGPVASWLIEAVNLVTGNFDREGGVIFASPAADVGRLARHLLPKTRARFRSRVRGLPEFMGALPSAVMLEEMETEGRGRIRGFVTFAGNPVLSTPGGDRLAGALAKLDFMAAIDFYLNETTRLAHIVLPAAHPFETSNYELLLLGLAVRNVVKWSPPVVLRAKDARDDWEILFELSMRLRGIPGPIARRLRERGRDLPDHAIDALLRLGPYDLDLDKVRAAPHGIDLGPLKPSRRRFPTPDGRPRLAPEVFLRDLPRVERWVDARARGPRSNDLVLIGRRHLRSNNSWMHNAPSLVKGPPRTQLLMHPSDARRLGLEQGDRVEVASRAGCIQTELALTDALREGVVSLPHGFGHGVASATLRVAGVIGGPNVNTLTDGELIEPLIGASILTGFEVTVRKALSASPRS